MTHGQTNITSEHKTPARWIAVLAMLLLVALFGHLGYLELSGEEPRRAVVALEMMESGNYIVPHAYGIEYYNKPPVYNWMLGLSMAIFGVNEWAVRLPGILSFIFIAICLFYWLSKHMNRTQAMLPALLFLFSADLLYYGTVFPAEIDLAFTLFLFLQAIGIFRIGIHPDRWSGYMMAYGFLVAAILTKGWLAVHYHVFALIAWTLYLRNFKTLFSPKHISAILLACVTLALYFFLFSLDGNLSFLLLNNFIESGSKIVETNFLSVLNQITETPLALLKICLPWSLLLFFFFKKRVRTHLNTNRVFIFSVLYILSNIWLYWAFIDVRDRYLYPMIPFVCILIYSVINYKKWWPSRSHIFLIVLAIMLTIRISYNFFVMPQLDDGRLSDDYIYRELTDTLLVHSEGNAINLLTGQKSEPLPFEWNGINEIPKQPWIPYQIPFYLKKKSGHIMKLVEQPVPGDYYLIVADQHDILKGSDSLYSFTERWFGKPMVLVRVR